MLGNDDLKNDLSASVVAALSSVGLDVDDGFRDRLLIMSAESRQHRSDHQYSPEQFDLSDETIASHFERVYALYQFRQHSKPGDETQ